jgi:hypothetical protein
MACQDIKMYDRNFLKGRKSKNCSLNRARNQKMTIFTRLKSIVFCQTYSFDKSQGKNSGILLRQRAEIGDKQGRLSGFG